MTETAPLIDGAPPRTDQRRVSTELYRLVASLSELDDLVAACRTVGEQVIVLPDVAERREASASEVAARAAEAIQRASSAVDGLIDELVDEAVVLDAEG